MRDAASNSTVQWEMQHASTLSSFAWTYRCPHCPALPCCRVTAVVHLQRELSSRRRLRQQAAGMLGLKASPQQRQ